MVIWVQNVQTELMVEIYSKSLVRAVGKVLLARTPIKMAFVCKQTAVLVIRVNKFGQ